MGRGRDRYRVPGRGLGRERCDRDDDGSRARSRTVLDHSQPAPLVTESHHFRRGHRVRVIGRLLGDAA